MYQAIEWDKEIGDIPYPSGLIEHPKDSDSCAHCGGLMLINDNMLECSKCCMVIRNVGDTSFSSENTVFGNTMVSFRYEGGPTSELNRRNKMNHQTCSDSSAYRQNQDKKKLSNINAETETKRIPKTVIDLVMADFQKIKAERIVYRGNGKKGVMAALIYYRCMSVGVARTPRDLCTFLEIPQKKFSEGDRKVQKHIDKGILDFPICPNSYTMYVNQYMILLGIDLKYVQFVLDLIKRAEDKKIHIMNESKTTTKCVGAIYMLITRLKLKISKDTISKECNISGSTFIKYFKMLNEKYWLIKKPFKKHGIRMPRSWKEIPDFAKPDKPDKSTK